MAVVAALVAGLLWVGGWIALIASVPAASVGDALLVCAIIHGAIIFGFSFAYALFHL